MDGQIEIDPLITHAVPLEDINKAFDFKHAGESEGAWWSIEQVAEIRR